jgi:endonuclease/exonuclease/phosphatase (EEP) superfamily protein YafD
MKRRLAWAIALVAGLNGFLGLLGAWAPALDTLNHFAPLALGLALGALVLAIRWARRRVAIMFAAFGVACQLGLMAPELTAGMGQRLADRAETDTTVAVLNLWGRNPDPAASGAYLAGTGADLMILLETRPENIAGLDATGLPYRTSCQGRFFACSATLLSRHPFLEEGRDLCAIAVAATVQTPQLERITLVGVHLNRPWPDSARHQHQMACLAQEVAALRAQGPVLIAGDFNAAPWSFALRRMDAQLPGFSRITRAMPTWPAGGARISRFGVPTPGALLPIDHVYVGEGLTASGVARGPAVGSDHHPIIVRLRRDL